MKVERNLLELGAFVSKTIDDSLVDLTEVLIFVIFLELFRLVNEDFEVDVWIGLKSCDDELD